MVGFRLVALPPWRRGPLLFLAQRGVVATVVLATAVVVAALGSLPVFLSSVGTGAVQVQAADRCGPDTGASFTDGVAVEDLTSDQVNPFASVGDRLGAPQRWVVWAGEQLSGSAPGDGGVGVTVVSADGAFDHIEIVDGDPDAERSTAGWWITDRTAEMTGLGVGDLATVGTTEATVVGVYRDEAGPLLDDYWCADPNLLLPVESGGDVTLPPPVVLVDLETAAQVVASTGFDVVGVTWHTSLGDSVTAGELPGLIDDLACGDPGLALAWCEDSGSNRAGVDDTSPEPLDRAETDRFVRVTLGSHLGYVSRRTDGIVATVAAGIVPIGVFAAGAGLAMMAAAGGLWHERREREIRLLLTRGLGPGSVAVKALLEMLIPMIVGAALGLVTALLAARWLGPSWLVEGRAVGVGIGLGVAGLTAVVAVVGAVTYVRARKVEGGGRRRVRLGWIPWELLGVWASAVAYGRLGQWGVPVSFRDGAPGVDVWGLLFPVLFLVTSVLIGTRLLGFVLKLLRGRSMTVTSAAALAVRRMYRARRAVLGLLASAAVAAGVLGLAVTLQQSLSTTLDVKGFTFAGSDVVVRLGYDAAIPALDASTIVMSPGSARLVVDGERKKAVLRGIDPATFASAAFWDSSMADQSLEAITKELSQPGTDRALRAVVVEPDGDVVEGPMTLEIAGTRRVEVTIEPISGVAAFPSMRRGDPTVFVSAPLLQQLQPTLDVEGGVPELWVNGDRDVILDQLDQTGVDYAEYRTTSTVADRLAFQTIDWTFRFVIAVGSVAGVLVFAGVAVYLDAAHRGRMLGYTFLRRMGLSRRTHRRAIALELAGTIVVGVTLGLTMAWLAVRLAYHRIDPVPGYPPPTVFRPAIGLSLLIIAGCALATIGAATLAQRRLDREDPNEVLRAGI